MSGSKNTWDGAEAGKGPETLCWAMLGCWACYEGTQALLPEKLCQSILPIFPLWQQVYQRSIHQKYRARGCKVRQQSGFWLLSLDSVIYSHIVPVNSFLLKTARGDLLLFTSRPWLVQGSLPSQAMPTIPSLTCSTSSVPRTENTNVKGIVWVLLLTGGKSVLWISTSVLSSHSNQSSSQRTLWWSSG